MLRWIGAVIGFLAWDWRGAVLGYCAGFGLDKLVSSFAKPAADYQDTVPLSMKQLFVLALAVMKAGGGATRGAVLYIERYFNDAFGFRSEQFLAINLHTTDKQKQFDAIRSLVNRRIPLEPPCSRLKRASVDDRLRALRFFFGVARASGVISRTELITLEQISFLVGLTTASFNIIRDEFCSATGGGNTYSRTYSDNYTNSRTNTNSGNYTHTGANSGNTHDDNQSRPRTPPSDPIADAYALLGIPSTATDDEVKKAYRLAAKKYHPDKFNHKGEATIAAAAKKFIAINSAYEKIKKDREP